MRCLALHLEPGTDVRQALEQVAAQEGGSGFVLSVVGNLSQAAFQCPGKASPTLLAGELEIITLQGTLAAGGVHLHLSFSDDACQVWGGHLEPGTLVLKGADLLVGLFDPEPLQLGPEGPSQPETAIQAPPPVRPRATSEPRVEIAVLPGCPFSARALRMLRTLGIPHGVTEPSQPGSVPQVFIDGAFIGGYDALAELHAQGQLEHLRGF
jgi:predicted DNA-binding protein with PD1-like motif/glutaredoxin